MQNIKATDVRKVRMITGAGIMECKRALLKSSGDIELALDELRKMGIKKADSKSLKVASDGVICIKIDNDSKRGIICEINTQTDFVARNTKFVELAKSVVNHIHDKKIETLEQLAQSKVNGAIFTDYFKSKTSSLGENILVRRVEVIKANSNEIIGSYCHSNSKVGAIVLAKVKNKDLVEEINYILEQVCMQIVALRPMYLKKDDFPDDIIEKEKEIAKETLKKQSLTKPENIIDRIISGKIDKFISENSLLGQKFIMDEKKSVKDFLKQKSNDIGDNIELCKYVRFEIGENI